MLLKLLILLLTTNYCILPLLGQTREFKTEEELIEWLGTEYKNFATENCFRLQTAKWNYETNVNANTEEELAIVTQEVTAQRKEFWEQYFSELNIDDYTNEALIRQLKSLKNIGSLVLSDDKLQELTNAEQTLMNGYKTERICPYNNRECDLETEGLYLVPEIEEIMLSSTNYEELTYFWEAWSDARGAKLKDIFGDYVDLYNEAAQLNGFEDAGDMWRSPYEYENFIDTLDNLWEEIKPLYEELHKYVRKNLEQRYVDMDTSDEMLPANVFGAMSTKSWINLEPIVRPYPSAGLIDISEIMIRDEYTAKKIFETAEELFKAIRVSDNSISYNDEAMLEKPESIDVICDPSAWDFCDGTTYRVKMCANISTEDYSTAHYLLGYIQYYIQYKAKPITFRNAAFPALYEALGNSIVLSATTPTYLEKMGLLEDYGHSEQAMLNHLMKLALDKLPLLAYSLATERWRWDVFNGLNQAEWNERWWQYRNTYEKVKAPVDRDNNDFDPGAEFHVTGSEPLINNFMATILGFQLHRRFCIIAGQHNITNPDLTPLYNCDFSESRSVGSLFKNSLPHGSSLPWRQVLGRLNQDSEIYTRGIMTYFKPLYEYILSVNGGMSSIELQAFLEGEYAEEAQEVYSNQVHAEWNYATDINEETAQKQIEATLATAAFDKRNWENVFGKLNESSYVDEVLHRQVKFLRVLGDAALDEARLSELTSAISSMSSIYNTAKICPYDNQQCDQNTEGLALNPGIEERISASEDIDELLYLWTAWRSASGANMREHFDTYVKLSNDAAVANGFADKGEMWRNRFESSTFIEDLDRLWERVEPLYNELHKYVRRKLRAKYGNALDLSYDLIPAHVLGNMWAQSWVNIAPLVKPYPEVSSVNITAAMIEKGYDVQRMFEVADEFYTSLRLESCAMSFGEGSMIVRPEGREVNCHASAWDFNDGETFRVKMCTNINYEDFITIHHELGHIEYYLLYKDQPITLRTGANPGFHEAVGDTIALSVATPQHFKTIGLIDDVDQDEEEARKANINSLMDMALERIAFLPFGLLIDKWRWDVFSGTVDSSQWNKQWWHYRETIQKVKSPVARTEDDFDPGAKFHVAADSQYISYFVAHILEFQFFKALCIKAGEYGEGSDKALHECDYYGSKEAGDLLRAGLSLGASRHWEDVLEIMTESREMSADALLEYFDPLYEFLLDANDQEVTQEELEDYIYVDYQFAAVRELGAARRIDWEFDLNTGTTSVAKLQSVLETAAFRRYWRAFFEDIEYTKPDILQQLEEVNNLGDAVLNDDKLSELTSYLIDWKRLYSSVRVCPYKIQNCNILEEGLDEEDIQRDMAISEDPAEMLYYWRYWRDLSGQLVDKGNYGRYISVANEAAIANSFSNRGDQWRSQYGLSSGDFRSSITNIWDDVAPFYDYLHDFAIRKLKSKYGVALDVADGLIPAHVLGSLWGESWWGLTEVMRPHPNNDNINLNSILADVSIPEIADLVDTFFKSMELEETAAGADALNYFSKPSSESVCEPKAVDIYGQSHRVKICSTNTRANFKTVHNMLSHVQSFMLYKDQPVVFRNAPTPALYDAVGGAIALSAITPQHLIALGLIEEFDESENSDLNLLMDTALETLPLLPFALVVDNWRWDVFGSLQQSSWNSRWWMYREEFQKVKAPVTITESDFDAISKYHVLADEQYINKFVSTILQFQIYKELCVKAGKYNRQTKTPPLHRCSLFGSSAAGAVLKDALSRGSSEDWVEILQTLTGETEVNASAMLEYFEPLHEYFFATSGGMSSSDLKAFLEGEYAEKAQEVYSAQVHAGWNYATDVNEETAQLQIEATLATAVFDKENWENVFGNLHENNFVVEVLKRQVKFLRVLGDAALDEKNLSELKSAVSSMSSIYNTAKVCPYEKQQCDLDTEGLALNPGIEERISASEDVDELLYFWTAWRSASGANMREHFDTYVRLSNDAAVANGFADKGEMWRNRFESSTFIEDLDRLWETVEPLYNELHKYVRRKLRAKFGNALDLSYDLIPAHVLGNMWAQSWINIAPVVQPYPEVSSVNITAAMIEKGYDVQQMFEVADEFYTSLGLESCTMSFGEGSMIVRPEGREVNCHASAWDFRDGETFRVKMCTNINYEDFITIHHELGHIEYFLLYKDQPITLRTGANPGFHEAVGDTIALSVATPQHFKTIGLIDDVHQDEEEARKASINSLMDMALERIAFLPFGLLIDKWRWDVFSGTVDSTQWNKQWWHYRETIQKVKSPVARTEDDFDPGAKYHVAADSQYISYFVAHILEFQFFKALCIKAGEYGEGSDKALHECDYYKSKEAGDLLRAGLSLGASRHWEDVLEIMTESREMSADALLEYFNPLYEFLLDANDQELTQEELENYIYVDYQFAAVRELGAGRKVDWQFDLNMGATSVAKLESVLETAAFRRYWRSFFASIEYTQPDILQQLEEVNNLGDAALSDDKLSELTGYINDWKLQYTGIRVCPFQNSNCVIQQEGLDEEEIQRNMANSENLAEMLFYWRFWKIRSGQLVDKNNYGRYISLANEAAVANSFSNRGDQWRSQYGLSSENFRSSITNIWDDVEPLYDYLHTFVRRKLKSKYGDALDVADELIPAHVLGSLWGETWWGLTEIMRPRPNNDNINLNSILSDVTIPDIADLADTFFKSIELEGTAAGADALNYFSKPSAQSVCEPTAVDIYGENYRVKICSTNTRDNFKTVHNMLSHVQSFMLYKDQPVVFRNAPTPALYDAVGGAIALSAITPQHLIALELIEKFDESEDSDLNLLMDTALETLPLLPFALVVDNWRWDVFGSLQQSSWNSQWWQYREDFQKVKSPVTIEDTDFDAISKYHVLADEQYINKFVSSVLQFQIYKELCIKAGKYNPETKNPPLHRCSFFGSSEAGAVLKDALSHGSSEDWSEILKTLTGETEVDASAMLEYFEPLHDYFERGSSVMIQFSFVTYICSFLFVYFLPRLMW